MRCLALSPSSLPRANTSSSSAPLKTRNISLRTTSVDSPMPWVKVATCSIAGVSIALNPYAPKSSRAMSHIRCQLRI